MAFIAVGNFSFAQDKAAPKDKPAMEKAAGKKGMHHDKKDAGKHEGKDGKGAEDKTKMKKDGTPDMRMKENKAPKTKHLKKDGTPDKRYKENKAETKK